MNQRIGVLRKSESMSNPYQINYKGQREMIHTSKIKDEKGTADSEEIQRL